VRLFVCIVVCLCVGGVGGRVCVDMYLCVFVCGVFMCVQLCV
jgi:hypothetical protein